MSNTTDKEPSVSKPLNVGSLAAAERRLNPCEACGVKPCRHVPLSVIERLVGVGQAHCLCSSGTPNVLHASDGSMIVYAPQTGQFALARKRATVRKTASYCSICPVNHDCSLCEYEEIMYEGRQCTDPDHDHATPTVHTEIPCDCGCGGTLVARFLDD